MLRALIAELRRRKPRQQPKPDTSIGLSVEQYESFVPVQTLSHDGVDVVYCTPNRLTQLRVDSLFSKEPDTIAWIAEFQSEDVFVDIGANVGMYAIWAAKTRGVEVYAFEPESQNYAVLYRNIILNDLTSRVVAYCAALSDENSFSLLYLDNFLPGGACHTFGSAHDQHLQPRQCKYTQGCFATSLDKLVGDGVLPVPTHIKIDVDGLEHKVLGGCKATLADKRLKSVLVELNTNLPEHRALCDEMAALGFSYDAGQVAAARRQAGPFEGVGNYVFRR